MNWKVYYSRVHGQIHLAAQFTSGVLLHFQNALWKAGFLVLKGKKWDTPPPPPPVTPKLKVRELSQSGFWNIWSHPTSVPSFSQISWPQLLAPGTLFRTMTLKPTIGTPQPYSSFKYEFCTSYLRRILLPFTPIVLNGWFSLSMELVS